MMTRAAKLAALLSECKAALEHLHFNMSGHERAWRMRRGHDLLVLRGQIIKKMRGGK